MNHSLPKAPEPSLLSLIVGIIHDVSALFSEELKMARLEIHGGLRKTRSAAVNVGLGLGVVAVGGFLLLLMLVHLLHAYTVLPLWASYGVVGCLVSAAGLFLLYSGKSTAGNVGFLPRQTAEAVKEDVRWITEHTRSARKGK